MNVESDNRSGKDRIAAAKPAIVDPPEDYRAPRVVSFGTASQLMRRDGSGHLIDGTGGWWVWGS